LFQEKNVLKTLFRFLSRLVGNSLARMMTGAGVGFVSFAAMMPLALGALNAANQGFSGIGSDAAGLIGLAGFGEAMSIIGSAILTRVALDSVSLGIAKSGSTT
jgi:hypothetical protein